eukprot:3584674-Rhodomonas_salina.2
MCGTVTNLVAKPGTWVPGKSESSVDFEREQYWETVFCNRYPGTNQIPRIRSLKVHRLILSEPSESAAALRVCVRVRPQAEAPAPSHWEEAPAACPLSTGTQHVRATLRLRLRTRRTSESEPLSLGAWLRVSLRTKLKCRSGCREGGGLRASSKAPPFTVAELQLSARGVSRLAATSTLVLKFNVNDPSRPRAGLSASLSLTVMSQFQRCLPRCSESSLLMSSAKPPGPERSRQKGGFLLVHSGPRGTKRNEDQSRSSVGSGYSLSRAAGPEVPPHAASAPRCHVPHVTCHT